MAALPPAASGGSPRRASGASGLATLALCAALLAGCDFEVDVPIDVPPLEPALVVYSFPSPDSVWTVRVGRTLPLGEYDASARVDDAEVRLFEDGALVETLELVDTGSDEPYSYYNPLALYRSARGLRPEPGRDYRVEVDAPGLPLASAETRLPAPPEAVLVADGPITPGPYGSSRRVRVTLDDPAGEDVYELAVIGRYRYEGVPSSPEGFRFFSSPSPSFRDGYDLLDVDIAAGGRDTDYCCDVVFRDRLFDGTRRTFELKLRDLYANPDAEEILSVLLVRVSPEFARHEIRRTQQEINVGNPFAEPSPLYSNVEGGHGVVGGFTPVRLAIPAPPTDGASGATP